MPTCALRHQHALTLRFLSPWAQNTPSLAFYRGAGSRHPRWGFLPLEIFIRTTPLTKHLVLEPKFDHLRYRKLLDRQDATKHEERKVPI